jgi:predicted PurR-regulated permease PerM
LAVLTFGTLYGVLGILIAIPMAAVIQVLLERVVVNAELARAIVPTWARRGLRKRGRA